MNNELFDLVFFSVIFTRQILPKLNFTDILNLRLVQKDFRTPVTNYCYKNFFWKFSDLDIKKIKLDPKKIRKIKINDFSKFQHQTYFMFGKIFNAPAEQLPSLVTHITFGYEFNEPVENLPLSVTHLVFGDHFIQSVDHLPKFLTHLSFGYRFNGPVNNLPDSLTHLSFGYCFNRSVNHLPNSLIYLEFGHCFNQPINNFPNSITHLTIDSSRIESMIVYLGLYLLTESITHLTLKGGRLKHRLRVKLFFPNLKSINYV
jgi:hypothetical protein